MSQKIIQSILVLASDFNDFNQVAEVLERGGLERSFITNVTSPEDITSDREGTPIYITASAPQRKNYKQIVCKARQVGLSPQAVSTPVHMKELYKDSKKTMQILKYDAVWDAVEMGINPGCIILEEAITYNKEEHKLDCRVGIQVAHIN